MDTTETRINPDPKTEKSKEEVIDVHDIGVGELFRNIKRLKLSSVATFAGILLATHGFVATYFGNIENDAIKKKDEQIKVISNKLDSTIRYFRKGIDSTLAFANYFSLRFSDKRNLTKLIPEILKLHPDGIGTYEEALQSLVWQVKSQNGFAQFMSGDKAINLRLVPDSTSTNLIWTPIESALPSIHHNLHLDLTPAQLAQYNAELNFFGMTWLSDGSTVVRDMNGGLSVVN